VKKKDCVKKILGAKMRPTHKKSHKRPPYKTTTASTQNTKIKAITESQRKVKFCKSRNYQN